MKIGEVYKSLSYGDMEVVGKNGKFFVVRFDDGTEVEASPQNIRKGTVKNPNYRSVYEIGYIGIGEFSRQKTPKIYSMWINMMQRCYSVELHDLHPTYVGCVVAKRWHCLQTFASDVKHMIGFHNIDRGWQLDKDILYKNNGKYSRKTCVLVPPHLNSVLTKSDSSRSKSGIWVGFRPERTLPYSARCCVMGKLTVVGKFLTREDAFLSYKEAKEKELVRLANVYKDEIDSRVFTALCNYIVDRDD